MPTEQMTIYPDRETLQRLLAEAKRDDRKTANMAGRLIKEALAARDKKGSK